MQEKVNVKGKAPSLSGMNWMVHLINWKFICKVKTSQLLNKVLEVHKSVLQKELDTVKGAYMLIQKFCMCVKVLAEKTPNASIVSTY